MTPRSTSRATVRPVRSLVVDAVPKRVPGWFARPAARSARPIAIVSGSSSSAAIWTMPLKSSSASQARYASMSSPASRLMSGHVLGELEGNRRLLEDDRRLLGLVDREAKHIGTGVVPDGIEIEPAASDRPEIEVGNQEALTPEQRAREDGSQRIDDAAAAWRDDLVVCPTDRSGDVRVVA